MEWDTNSLYGSEMLEPLPVGDFRNVREEGLRNLERSLKKGQPLPSGKGVLLCVDLDYPEHLHNSHNDYPLAQKRSLLRMLKSYVQTLETRETIPLLTNYYFFTFNMPLS